MKLAKEDLKNSKIRVPTPEIKDKVVKKLRELGFRVFIEWDTVGFYYIYDDRYVGYDFKQGGEENFLSHENKEIIYTDLIKDESPEFKDWRELYQWMADAKPVERLDRVYRFSESSQGDYMLDFSGRLSCYKKHIDPPKPKEVVLYRYTSKRKWTGYKLKPIEEIFRTEWTSFTFEQFFEGMSGYVNLKTETKTVILE